MKTTRRPRQRINEKLGDYNARLRAWLDENNAALYAVQHAKRGGELTEDEIDRNLEALAAQLANEPLPPASLAPSYKPTRHAEDERLGDEAPEAAPMELEHLQHQIAALTARVVALEKLVAASVAYRSLKPAAKAAVDRIDPAVGAAFKDKRTLLALTVYEHVATMERDKKKNANFPKLLWGEFVDSSVDKTVNAVRIIPYTALLHRLAAKKDFRPSLDETSSQENARLAIEKSGLIVTTLHETGLQSGSALLVVMDRVEAVARGLVKGLAAAPELEVKPRASFDKSAWQDEPEPVANDEDLDIIPASLVVLEPEPTTADAVDQPTTTDAVDDEEIDTETEWEEEEDDGYNEDPIALFRESGEQQKSSKAIDLFAE
jgi:NAD(P)H-dependent FMN reductase